MVVEVSYAEWTPDGLLRHVVYWASVKINRPHQRAPRPTSFRVTLTPLIPIDDIG
jgi:hypothetical protein